MTTYTENDIKKLVEDPESHETLVKVFFQMRHHLFCEAHKEHLWGPTNELMAKTRDQLDKCFDRISDQRRKK